ncbi:hypothetical protein BC354_13355 [Vibrio cholerae]|uniref:hypothetical protein n=1 Tax=Vibrio cholerae TaxID=666 RepID=UPI000E4951D9|nr:hypothetical protein [Vibrio cholerae]RGP86579.1 hypothetical protein BC354_13355 [Vibrio cholerae]RGP94343.1 hypothetical protein BC352_13010 [Vibrio cholerae]TQP68455.1 hypothetical protein FLL76_00490 [Vibrio cholerae]
MSHDELMMKLEQREQRILNEVVVGLSEREVFGTSAIQRLCGIGYNFARRMVERGVSEGLFCSVNDYQFSLTEQGKALSEKIKNQQKQPL